MKGGEKTDSLTAQKEQFLRAVYSTRKKKKPVLREMQADVKTYKKGPMIRDEQVELKSYSKKPRY